MTIPTCTCTAHTQNCKTISLRLEYKKDTPIVHTTSGIFIPIAKNDRKLLGERIASLTRCDNQLGCLLREDLVSCDTLESVCRFVETTFLFMHWKRKAFYYLSRTGSDSAKILRVSAAFLHALRTFRKNYDYLNDNLTCYIYKIEQEIALPLKEKAMAWLKSNPMRLTFVAAAAKGRALQAALVGMIAYETKQEILPVENTSRNLTFIRQDQCVFKQLRSHSLQEEAKIEHLFNLSMEEGVVPGFLVSQLGSYRFGHRLLKYEVYARSYIAHTIALGLRIGIVAKLDAEDKSTWEILQKVRLNFCGKHLHDFFRSCDYKLGDGEAATLCDFNEVRDKYLKNLITAATPIGLAGSPTTLPFLQFLKENKEFAHILNENALNQYEKHILFFPRISKELQSFYEKSELKEWHYQTNFGEWKKVSFKHLQEKRLLNEIHDDTLIRSTDAQALAFQNHPIRPLLDIGWRLYIPETRLFYENELTPVYQVVAKPFISYMTTIDKLTLNDELTPKILDRLDTDSELALMLSAEFQFLDLHQSNMGVKMVSEHQPHFCKYTYSFGNKYDVQFAKLLEHHLKGLIDSDTLIGLKKEGETTFHVLPLKKHKHLEECLNSRWRLIFFDTDLVLGESNYIHRVTVDRGTTDQIDGHLIPYRCDLLSMDFKDKPLSPEAIARWKDLRRINRVRDWIEYRDAPFRQLLTSKFTVGLNRAIEIVHQDPHFSFSFFLSQDKQRTFRDLRKYFANTINSIEVNSTFWKTLELFFEETGRTFYKDLSQDSEEALMKRWKISTQLFPRMTWYQKNALYDRQARCLDYLMLYEEMCEADESDIDSLVAMIKRSLNNESSPFTHCFRINLREQLEEITDKNALQITRLFRVIKQFMVPTYFNICKSMYPLLGDAYELISGYFEEDQHKTGLVIGHYLKPLELYIKKIKKTEDKESDLYKTALFLEQEITEQQKSFEAWFGNFHLPQQESKDKNPSQHDSELLDPQQNLQSDSI